MELLVGIIYLQFIHLPFNDVRFIDINAIQQYWTLTQSRLKTKLQLNFEHRIIEIPRFFKLFPSTLVFSLRNSFSLPRIFRTSFFQIPRFSEPFLRSLRMNSVDISNLYAEFWKIRT